jgi:hypothetical protein
MPNMKEPVSTMLLHRLKYLLLILPLLLCGTVKAEPLTLLMGIAALQSTFDNNKESPRGQQKTTTPSQQPLLAQLQQHPVINACLEVADGGNPVAAYHVRKLGQYAQSLHSSDANDNAPDPHRVTRAYRWCAQQAGIAEQDIALSLTSFSAALRVTSDKDMHHGLKLARAN